MEIFKRKFISKCKENGDLIWFFQKKVDMPLMFSRINVTYVRGYSLYYKHRRVKILPKAKLKR